MDVVYEALDQNETIISETYYHIVQKHCRKNCLSLVSRKVVLFLHNNARTRIDQVIQEKVTELILEDLPHHPHFLDFTPSDYHFFRLFDVLGLGWGGNPNLLIAKELKSIVNASLLRNTSNFYVQEINSLVNKLD